MRAHARIVATMVALALASCSTAVTRRAPAPSTERVAEADLIAAVTRCFHDHGLDAIASIAIEADGDRITLARAAGHREPQRATRRRAVELAETVPGVRIATWTERDRSR